MVRMTSRRDDGVRATQLGDLSARRRSKKGSQAYDTERDDGCGCRYRGWVLVERLGWGAAGNDARQRRRRMRRASGSYAHAVPSEVFAAFHRIVDEMEGDADA